MCDISRIFCWVGVNVVVRGNTGGTLGSARVFHHCDLGSIPAPCSCLVKVSLSHVRRVLSTLTLPSIAGFSLGTPVSSCSNTGPLRGGPYWTSRESSLCS